MAGPVPIQGRDLAPPCEGRVFLVGHQMDLFGLVWFGFSVKKQSLEW